MRDVHLALVPVLERLQNDAAAYFGETSVRLVPLEYHDRPFSHLMRVAVFAGGASSPVSVLFVKVSKLKPVSHATETMRARVEHDYAITCRLHRVMRGCSAVGVVPPVACYPEHLAIVTEEVRGPTLLEYLVSRAGWFPSAKRLDAMYRTTAAVGQWVRVFQETDAPGPRLPVHALRDYIDHRLKRLVVEDARRFSPRDRTNVLRQCDRLNAEIGGRELEQVPVHSDLALGNILVDGERIVVLDFAMTKRGTALHDVARLHVQMDVLAVKPYIRDSVVRRLQSNLLTGYDLSLSEHRPLFRLLVLLHRLNHLVTLRLERGRTAVSAYNRLVARRHYRWLREELAQGRSVQAHT